MKLTLIDIIYYAIVGTLFIISFIASVKQHAKQKNISKLQALYECIPNAVINAEKMFGTGNGENKKLFVMTTLSNIALQSHTKFDYNDLDKQVENVVKATKTVNVNVLENVDETFRTEDEPKTNETGTVETIHELTQTDGAVVIEIDKIKGDEENGSDN